MDKTYSMLSSDLLHLLLTVSEPTESVKRNQEEFLSERKFQEVLRNSTNFPRCSQTGAAGWVNHRDSFLAFGWIRGWLASVAALKTPQLEQWLPLFSNLEMEELSAKQILYQMWAAQLRSLFLSPTLFETHFKVIHVKIRWMWWEKLSSFFYCMTFCADIYLQKNESFWF